MAKQKKPELKYNINVHYGDDDTFEDTRLDTRENLKVFIRNAIASGWFEGEQDDGVEHDDGDARLYDTHVWIAVSSIVKFIIEAAEE